MAKILTSNNAQIFRQLGSRQFRAAPVDHEVATSGQELLARARHSRPALVIIDSLLPDGSGFDACRRIKADPGLAGTRVMLLLDNPATPEQLRDAELSGCDDILCLPAPTDELFGHIAAVLASRRRLAAGARAAASLTGTRRRPAAGAGDVIDLRPAARMRLSERIPPARVIARLLGGDRAGTSCGGVSCSGAAPGASGGGLNTSASTIGAGALRAPVCGTPLRRRRAAVTSPATSWSPRLRPLSPSRAARRVEWTSWRVSR